jgi:hypothetical protein
MLERCAGRETRFLKVERMKKFIISLAAAFQRGRAVVRNANSPREIMTRLAQFDSKEFSPPIERIRKLGHRLEEIKEQAREAEQDIVQAFNQGDDIHSRVADLGLVFTRYGDVFAEISAENSTLAKAARVYASRLDQLIGTAP